MEQEHKQITLAWAKATERMQAVLREELERLEEKREELRPKTILLTERIGKLKQAEQDRKIEIGELLTTYPKMEAREKGEAFRRLFKKVTPFWDKTFHARKPGTKYYKHKTKRPGRWKYTLNRAAIKWVFRNQNWQVLGEELHRVEFVLDCGDEGVVITAGDGQMRAEKRHSCSCAR